jgi:hypothetical protein
MSLSGPDLGPIVAQIIVRLESGSFLALGGPRGVSTAPT